MAYAIVALIGTLTLGLTAFGYAGEPERSPQQWLDHFAQEWREGDWSQGDESTAGYMRPLDDAGWQARMLAMQGLVQQRDDAVAVLLKALRTGDAPQRILAAQTLGYLGADVPTKPLVEALQSEQDPAVRLYLVDSLGMLGKGDGVDWDAFLQDEPNRDVKRHVGYLRERDGTPLDDDVVETLKRWDGRRMDTAQIGKPAPDFTLTSMQGDRVKLSDYRGKQAVVLVFIYGDT